MKSHLPDGMIGTHSFATDKTSSRFDLNHYWNQTYNKFSMALLKISKRFWEPDLLHIPADRSLPSQLYLQQPHSPNRSHSMYFGRLHHIGEYTYGWFSCGWHTDYSRAKKSLDDGALFCANTLLKQVCGFMKHGLASMRQSSFLPPTDSFLFKYVQNPTFHLVIIA